jgi:hypothetical protein
MNTPPLRGDDAYEGTTPRGRAARGARREGIERVPLAPFRLVPLTQEHSTTHTFSTLRRKAVNENENLDD